MDKERFVLEIERVKEIVASPEVASEFQTYFRKTGEFLLLLKREGDFVKASSETEVSLSEWEAHNLALYEDVLPEAYGESFANPAYAVSLFGEDIGRFLSTLSFEMRSAIPFVYDSAEASEERFMQRVELFLEVYGAFAAACRDKEQVRDHYLKKILYRYLYDCMMDETLYEVERGLAGERDAANLVLTEGDTSDLRTVYRYGEYVGRNEKKTAAFLGSLPEEEINKLAETLTEGYRRGFEITGKDITKKERASLFYHVGFERIMVKVAAGLEAIGMESFVVRGIPTLFRMFSGEVSGLEGGAYNLQYLYDHKEDLALVLDDELVQRRLNALESSYDRLGEQTVLYGGPVALETFGESPFSPMPKKEAVRYAAGQQKKIGTYKTKASILFNKAVIGEEKSFTVIAFPLPEISETQYEEIFREVVKINTLDSESHSKVQQYLVDAMDEGEMVHVFGKNGNETDLKVSIYKVRDKAKESAFENCVADVNIPAGEVFTSPVLEGTEGLLHVTYVYLEGLLFKDLKLRFQNGRVCAYSCENFGNEEEGKAYIEKNILYHQENLPMGEFAIGTNTLAYVMARKYGIEDRLPILIAEKTGPHFAVGDTCYAHEEDNKAYNPDGKEIVAKENSCSAARKTNPEKAYFGCHLDITIPFDELGGIDVVTKEGERIPILHDGRFVLPGTESLNAPLIAFEEEMQKRDKAVDLV